MRMLLVPSSCLSILTVAAVAWILGATSVALAVTAPCISQADKASRVGLKTSIYGGFAYGRAAGVAAGTTNPVENYDWHNAVVVHNWEIRPDKIDELEDYLHLADIGVSIAPVRILEQDDDENEDRPKIYLLSLSCKQIDVSDQDPRTTNQCDWMMYVQAPESGPEPTLMIIESAYDFEAVSPLGPIPQSPLVEVAVGDENNTIVVQIDSTDTQLELLLDATLLSPQKVDKDFVYSFDKLYWPNGVYSRLFSDGSLSLAKPLVLNRSDNAADNEEDRKCTGKKKKGQKGSRCSKKKSKKSDKSSDDTDTPSAIIILDHTSRWSEFIDQSPYQIMYFPETITLGAEIWLNAVDIDTELFAARAEIYSNRATIEAAEVAAGLREPIAAFVVETDNVPSYYINFRIRDDRLHDLEAAIPLPDGLTIAPTRMRKNGPLEYIVTLNMYEASGLSPGLRGEWSTFVELDGISSEPHFFVLEAVSSTPSFDPVNLFTAPALSIEYNLEMGVLTSSYSLPNDVSYFLSFPMPESCNFQGQQRGRKTSTQHRFTAESKCDELLFKYWVSNDIIYWGNGIYDRGIYDGNAVATPVSIIDPSLIAVDISSTPWAEFVEPNPSDLLVVQQPLHFLISPMFNVEELDTCER